MEIARRWWLVLAIAIAPALAVAAPKRTFSVDIRGDAWRVEALTAALAADLTDDQLEPVKTGSPDLVISGALEGPQLRYELRAMWPGAPAPVRGVVPLGKLDRVGFAGVLRDKLHRIARTTEAVEGKREIEVPSVIAIVPGIALAAGMMLAPFLLGFVLLRDRKVLALPALRRTIVITGVASVAAIAITALGEELANATGLLLATGGLAWGTWVAVTFPIVFPSLAGLSRVEHDELPRILRLWLVVTLERLVAAAALYVPVAVVTWLVGELVGLDDAVLFALVLPVAMLVARSIVRSAVAVLALSLDAQLTDKAADAKAWDAAVRAYLIGYFKRNGLAVDHDLLASVDIVPGSGHDVAVYGGGATNTRIVIPRPWLEVALAPPGRPHDYAAPRVSTLHWAQWNTGLVMPTDPGAVIATKEQRQPRSIALEEEAEAEREQIGEPPTLAGVVEPAQLDKRNDFRPDEDPLWLEWDIGEEYDGTDAGDRDFLFGVLVHALSMIQRHSDRWQTFLLVARRRMIVHKLEKYVAWLTRAPAALGDSHAALGGARHHLVQYLSWLLWRREDLLTARAYGPELEAASRRVLHLLTESEARDARLGYRLTRLGMHVRGAPPVPVRRWHRLVLAGALVAGAGIAVLAILDAVSYHDTYEARMEKPDGKAK